MKLRYTPEAISDLREIRSYLKDTLHAPAAAERIPKEILDSCATLKRFPKMGMSIAAKTGFETDLRMLVCGKWIAIYRIDPETDTIYVARIMNARQDHIRLLFGDLEALPEQSQEEE